MKRRILQLGCGSMGSRRMRDLSRRPDVEVRAFDGRPDRRQSAESRFGVKTFPTMDAALAWEPEAFVISTPPGTKGPLVDLAFERGIHHFVEADIWSYGAADRVGRHTNLVCAPSLTFSFLPVFKALVDAVPSTIGPLLGYQFTLAGDMNGWHPGEGTEYYGRHRDTAPAREMVPFEIAWLVRLFGRARRVTGGFNQYNPRPGSFEDTWSMLMQLENGGTGQVTVTMGCPHDFRRGWAFGANGTVVWDINRGEIVLRGADGLEKVQQHGLLGQLIEPTYALEIGAFVDAIQGKAAWTHSYEEYQHGLATLAAAETAARAELWTNVQPSQEPTRVLAKAGP
jgi:predicted dehydrogenase